MSSSPSVTIRQVRQTSNPRFTDRADLMAAAGPYVTGWRAPSLEPVFRVRPLPHPRGHVVTQPGGSGVLCASTRGEYALLDGQSGETLGTARDPVGFSERPFAPSACGRFVIYGWGNAARVRELGTNALQWERKFQGGYLSGLHPMEDGRSWALEVIHPPSKDGREASGAVELWRWPFSSKPEPTFSFVGRIPSSTAVSRAGRIVTIGSAGPGTTTMRVLPITTGIPAVEIPAHFMDRLVGWLDEQRFACAQDDVVKVHDAATGNLLSRIELPGSSRYACRFAPNGRDLVVVYYERGIAYVQDAFDPGRAVTRIDEPWPRKRAPSPPRGAADVWARSEPATTMRSISAPTMEALKAELAELARPAWTPALGGSDGPLTASKFGGMPYLAKGSGWPQCGVCDEPLQLALQLSSTDLPSEQRGLFAGLLQVFFCTTESCAPETPFRPNTLVRLASIGAEPQLRSPPFAEAFLSRQITGWERHTDYPTADELALMGVELADGPEIDGELLTPLERDKLAGWPGWVHNVEYVKCPKCGGRMRVILHLESEESVPYMWGDGGCAWVSQCPTHKTVLAFHCGG